MPYTQLHIHMNLEKGVKQHIIGMEMGHDVDTGKNFCYLLQYHTINMSLNVCQFVISTGVIILDAQSTTSCPSRPS